ncbi:MAG: FHA domain-containing protein [Anaerolineae bacterium]|nr:FHA domain-containing protein [Anaerolineae bacterium]
MTVCPNCQRENHEAAKICAFCGAPLDNKETSTRTLKDTDFEEGRPQWGTARFNDRMYLSINIRDAEDRHIFYFDEFDELTLGRTDPETGDAPDLDLEGYDATEKGVSRRHALIIRRDTSLNLLDMNSPNGTFLNGQRLVPNQPRLLRDGDEIRLGHLVMRILFARA